MAAVLVSAGLLMGITFHHVFFLLLAAGAFGPGLLRQLGLLSDLDELQRGIMMKAGHLSFVVTGIFVTVVLVILTWGASDLEPSPLAAYVVLLLLLVVYSMAYAITFWGARRAARSILLGFACFWLTFVLLSHAAEPGAAAIEALTVVGPFLAAAAACVRFPRLVGALLLAVSGVGLYFFGLVNLDPSAAGQFGSRLAVIVTLILPLATVGVALVGSRSQEV